MNSKPQKREVKPPTVPYIAPSKSKAKISTIHVGERLVTRSKKRFYDFYNVKDCYVSMSKNISSEALAWLKKTETIPKSLKIVQLKASDGQQEIQLKSKIGNRRMSVAGTSLFSVNDRVVENAVDFLKKVPRENGIIQHALDRAESGHSEKENDNQFDNEHNDEIGCVTEEQPIKSKKPLPALLPLCRTKKNDIVETVKIVQPMVLNNFCPFRRLANVPFAIGGRPRRNRSKSVDFYASVPPPLETLFETEEEYATNVKEVGEQRQFLNLCQYKGAVPDQPIAAGVDDSVQPPLVDAVFEQTQATLNVVCKWVNNMNVSN